MKSVRLVLDEKRARLSSEESIVAKHDQTIDTQDQNTRSRSSSVSPNTPTQVTSTQFAAKFNSPTRSEVSPIRLKPNLSTTVYPITHSDGRVKFNRVPLWNVQLINNLTTISRFYCQYINTLRGGNPDIFILFFNRL